MADAVPPTGIATAWPHRPGYLDTATYGLPPHRTTDVSHRVVDEWSRGEVVWRAWNDTADEARRHFAALVGAELDSVAVGPATSTFVGLVAAALPGTAEVVVPEVEFTSLLFPLLAQTARGVTVRTVPLDDLAGAIGPATTAVAWSAVQSADGRIADADAVIEAAERAGALTVVDATQAAGWLPLPRVDVVVCSAYKWLCCPRGTAFMVTSRRAIDELIPHAAGWYAAEDVHGGYYGPPLRLADDARRFDVSPAWFAWAGAVPSLEALAAVGVPAIHDHDVRLADALRAELGAEPAGSAIVAVSGEGLEDRLAEVGIRAATRAGGCRLAFHLYNDDEDVAAAAAALRRAGARPA